MDKDKIKSQEEFQKLADTVFKDITYLDNNNIEFSDDFTTLVIKVKGEGLESTMTTSMMEGIIDIQKAIYKIYKQSVYNDQSKKLTLEERQKLELSVKVEKGSTLMTIPWGNVLNLAKEAVKNMTGEQILTSVVIISSTYLITKVASLAFNTNKEKHKENTEALKQQERDKSLTEQNKESLKTLKEVIQITSETQKNMYKHFSRSPFKEIECDGQVLTREDLKNEVKQEKKEKIEPTRRVVDGSYYVKTLHFEDADTHIDIVNETTKETIKKVALQDVILSEKDYKIIENAKDRDPINLRLILEEKEGRLIKAVIDSVLT